MFDLSTAFAVREREDGLLEKDTFDLSSARPVEEISAPPEPFRYSPPLTEEEKAQAVVSQVYKEAGKKVPIGLEADWVLTSKSAKMITTNVLGSILTGGIIPLYNAAKGIANAESPNSDIGKMIFDSAYKGLAENQKVENLGSAAQKAYPDAPWEITGSMGALAEVLMFMPGVIKGGAEFLSKDKQFTIALNNARQSPKWGDYVATVAKKANQPIEVVDQALYNKLWGLRNESNYFEVLNGNLKRATGIDLTKIPVGMSIEFVNPKVGQSVNFTNPQGLVKSGIIKEILGERAVIDLEGREVVATLSQLSLAPIEPKKDVSGGNLPSEQKNLETNDIVGAEGEKQPLKEAIEKETISTPIGKEVEKTELLLSQKSVEQNIEIPERPLEESMPQETDVVKKTIQALKEAKPIRAEQEALMKAERGRRIAKARVMGQKIGGEAGFQAQLGSLKGALPKAQFETLRGKITQPDIDALFNKIRQSDMNEWDKIGAQTGLGKLFGEFGGQVPTESELKLLNDVFGKEFTDTLISRRTFMQKFILTSKELLNVSRSVMTSVDLSAPLRQGAFMIGRIKQFGPAFVEMFKYFGSEKAFSESIKNITSRPTYELMRMHGLSLTDLGTGLNSREEKFMSNLAEKIPLVGKVIRASGRAYTGFLNKLRADVFDDLYSKAKSLGITETDKFMNDLAEFINSATGRGKLPGKIDKIAVALNSVFFSPRLMASRLNLLNPAFYITKEPFVRKEALKSLLTFASAALTILTLAKLSGAEVGTDWRSSDFGKIKIGNTRVDIMAGFQQYLRMAGQLITGQYISSSTGKIMTLGEGYRALNRWDIILRQFESKEAPVASFISNWLKGKDFTGEDFNVPQEVANRFVPMVIGDVVDLAKDNPSLLPLGVLGLFGVGLQTYENKPSGSFKSSTFKKGSSFKP